MPSSKNCPPPVSAWGRRALAGAAPVHTDVLVLGAGLAGLRAAIGARAAGCRVALAYAGRGASPFIIGCNAPFGHADAADTPARYFLDTVEGGYGLSDRPLVSALAGGATRGVGELDMLGVSIAKHGDRFAQRQLSGNWYARSVYHPRGLGAETLARLAVHAGEIGVAAMAGHRVVRLLADEDGVHGALLFCTRTARWIPVIAPAVVLALGGLGQLYLDTTYPGDVAASSYALAYEAGAALVDMEFVQFEPLCAFDPPGLHGLEMPTSMLAEGAQLLNSRGERFMFRHNPEYGEQRVEKARLSLCIQEEIDQGRGVGGGVIYDATRVPAAIVEGYVRHCKRLRHAGIDPAHLRIPIRPAAHSQMGGVRIDERTATGVAGLYAAGEASGGVHGASRIAGNGGADALVFGDLAGRHAAAFAAGRGGAEWAPLVAAAFGALESMGSEAGAVDASVLKQRVRALMTENAGIYRTGEGLQSSLAELDRLDGMLRDAVGARDDTGRIEAGELRAMLVAARAVTLAALARTESRGAHQRRDHPGTDHALWDTHLVVRQGADGRMAVETAAIRQEGTALA